MDATTHPPKRMLELTFLSLEELREDRNATTHPRKRMLELTVLSLEELREDRKHAAKSLYVAVRADSITSYATGTTADGGSPSWNERLVVEVPAHARSVTLKVKCRNAAGVKDVVVGRIAVEDILGGAEAGSDEECQRFLSYALKNSEDWESLHVSWHKSRSEGYFCPCFVASVAFSLFLRLSARKLQ